LLFFDDDGNASEELVFVLRATVSFDGSSAFFASCKDASFFSIALILASVLANPKMNQYKAKGDKHVKR
jgi:hypothetical protein